MALGAKRFGSRSRFLATSVISAQRVGGIVDGEVGVQSDVLGFAAQDPDAGGVEGGDPHGLGPAADEGLDPLPHFGGGLVGEGDGQDLAVVGPPRGDQVGDPVAEHPGLARAGTGHDQQGAAGVLDCFLLLRVQALEEFAAFGSRTVPAPSVAWSPGPWPPGTNPPLPPGRSPPLGPSPLPPPGLIRRGHARDAGRIPRRQADCRPGRIRADLHGSRPCAGLCCRRLRGSLEGSVGIGVKQHIHGVI